MADQRFSNMVELELGQRQIIHTEQSCVFPSIHRPAGGTPSPQERPVGATPQNPVTFPGLRV